MLDPQSKNNLNISNHQLLSPTTEQLTKEKKLEDVIALNS